jgi:hypothetical protein
MCKRALSPLFAPFFSIPTPNHTQSPSFTHPLPPEQHPPTPTKPNHSFGFSRDDVGGFIGSYLENKVLEKDPFETLDRDGVGQLMQTAVTKGRAAAGDVAFGICGEHGGDPQSVRCCCGGWGGCLDRSGVGREDVQRAETDSLRF